jgi:hypothetical protein
MKNDIKFPTQRYAHQVAYGPTKREYAIAILKLLGYVSIAILAIDFLVFCGWIISGQHPVDGFYIGSITANILKAILF